MSKKNPTKPVEKSQNKLLRNKMIIQKAMEGMPNSVIAEELNLARETVSQVMNSDEVKTLVKEIDNRLAGGIRKAADKILEMIDCDNPAVAYKAAYDLLKNFGSMKTTVNLAHTFPKPTVIVRKDGTRVILGTDQDKEENEE